MLHVTDIFPPVNQALPDSNALLATSYRAVITILGAALSAWLVPIFERIYGKKECGLPDAVGAIHESPMLCA
jgi:hypothetical protein